MKREISKRRNLFAFRIDLAVLESLVRKLEPHFDGEKCSYKIELINKHEKLQFDNLDELLEMNGLPPSIAQFELRFSGHHTSGKHLSFTASNFFELPYIYISGTDEAWCAGVFEVVWNTLSPYRLWYTWIRGFRLLLPSLIMSAIFPAIFIKRQALLTFTYLFIWVVFLLLAFLQGRIFPGSVLLISDRESWIKKHVQELMLLFTVLGFILSVIALIASQDGSSVPHP